MNEHHISFDPAPSDADWNAVSEGLRAYNHAQVGISGHQRLACFVRDAEGKIVGGILGVAYWGWLAIDILWLDESLRGQGCGSKLLAMFEDEGRARGCRNAHVDTGSFQALPFYLKHGYTVFGQLDDMPTGHTRYFLKKAL